MLVDGGSAAASTERVNFCGAAPAAARLRQYGGGRREHRIAMRFLDVLAARYPKMSDGTTKKSTNILRLACIVCGILLFVAIGLITTLSIIGMMKTITVWDLLASDIEQDGIENKYHAAANTEKLNKSLDRETVYSSICIIFTGFSTQLSCASFVLLYGLFMNKSQALYAWIIYSCTNILYMILFMVFLNRCTKINLEAKGINSWFEGFTVYLAAYNLLLYIYTRRIHKKQPLVVKAYGGYTHTVKQNQLLPEKSENYIV